MKRPNLIRPLPSRLLAALLAWCGLLAGAALAAPWSLERAVAFAMTNSPDARIAQHRITLARAGIEQANAAVWPKLQFQAGYTRTDNPMYSFGNILNQRSYSPGIDFNDVPTTDDLNVRGLVTAPLYAGGRIKSGREAAKAGTEAARQEFAAVKNTLAFEVTRAFYTVLKAREFIGAAESATNAFAQNLMVARRRFEAGALLKAEVLDLEVREAQAHEDLLRARNAQALALRALQNLLGTSEPDFDVAATAAAPVLPEDSALAQRPELAAFAQRERAAEYAVRGAKGGYLPKVSAFGSLDYDKGWETGGDGGSYTVGALLQWDLWDGQLTRAKVAEAQANLETVQEEARKVRLALDLEVAQARANVTEAGERLAVSERAIALARESAQLTRARFEEGAALSTQLIDAESALTAARVRHAEAEADRKTAIAALRRALGLPPIEVR